MKHLGYVANTGRRCAVVFRHIYDTNGKILDENHCLVVETESLPDYAQQDIMQIIESEPAQRTGNLFEAFARASLTDGNNALTFLHSTGRLRKVPTDNVILTPDSSTKIKLSKINKIIKLSEQGLSRDQIENIIRDDTDQPPRHSAVNDAVDSAIAQAPVVQKDSGVLAEEMVAKAERMIAEAEELKRLAAELSKGNFREEVKDAEAQE